MMYPVVNKFAMPYPVAPPGRMISVFIMLVCLQFVVFLSGAVRKHLVLPIIPQLSGVHLVNNYYGGFWVAM